MRIVIISPEGNSGGAFSCFMFCSLLSNVVLDGCSKGHTDHTGILSENLLTGGVKQDQGTWSMRGRFNFLTSDISFREIHQCSARL